MATDVKLRACSYGFALFKRIRSEPQAGAWRYCCQKLVHVVRPMVERVLLRAVGYANAGAGRRYLVDWRVRSALRACAESRIALRKRARMLRSLPRPPGEEEKGHPCSRL